MGSYTRAIQFFCSLNPTLLRMPTAKLAGVALLPKADPTPPGRVLQYLSEDDAAGPGDSSALSRCQEGTNHVSGRPELE